MANRISNADEHRHTVRALMLDGQTRTARQVGAATGLSRTTCARALRELQRLGLVDHVPAPEGSHYPTSGWGSVTS